jgi:hypothetical protein
MSWRWICKVTLLLPQRHPTGSLETSSPSLIMSPSYLEMISLKLSGRAMARNN